MIGRYNDNIYSMSVKQPDIKKIYKIDFVVKTYNKRMFKGLSSYVTSLQNTPCKAPPFIFFFFF